MKRKLLTIILAFFVAFYMNAQEKNTKKNVNQPHVQISKSMKKMTSVKGVIFSDDFSADLGWAYTGTWTREAAIAEPDADHTGDTYILANPIGVDYPNNMTREYVVSPVINCSGQTAVTLSYWSFSGCENTPYDNIGIEVYDGSAWVLIWSNYDWGGINQEEEWTYYEFDVTAQAAGNASFQVRFYLGGTDDSYQYSGWAIDDFLITYPVAHDLGVTAVAPAPYFVSGNTYIPTATVHNFGANDEDVYNVEIEITDANNGSQVYIDNVDFTYTITSWTDFDAEMSLIWIPDVGTYTITATVTLAGDTNTDNDIFSDECTDQPDYWFQFGQDIDGEYAQDQSGYSVSLSSDGSRVAVGAVHNPENGLDAGHVRIFEYNGTNWIQLGSDIDGEAAHDWFGCSVSLNYDGSRVAVGAPYNDGYAMGAGHVRIFEYNGTNWVQLGYDINGEAGYNNFGYSVSLSSDGSRVAAGAYSNDENGENSGHVRIFEYNGTSWGQLGTDIDGEAAGDESGYSVNLSSDGSRVAVGAYLNNGNGTDAGHVRIFEYNETNWVQLGTDIDGEAAGDQSGRSVSLNSDGSRVAVGARYNTGNGTEAGHVRIYEYDETNWIQLGTDIDGEAAEDRSGCSVSLNSDGSRVAVGARLNDGNGSQSGHVRIFEYNETAWVQLGSDIDGEALINWSGWSVSLNSYGSHVAIGAVHNDGNGNSSGHVRIFKFCQTFSAIDTAICNSDSYTSPSGNYTWASSGTYLDTIRNTAGCDSMITINLTVYPDTSVTQNGTTLTSNAVGAVYQWLDCNNGYSQIADAINQSFTATQTGSSAVEVTQNNCTDTSACYSVEVTYLTDIFAEGIKIYPNPTDGIININLPANYSEYQIIVQTIDGKTIEKINEINSPKISIKLKESKGIYFLHLINNNASYVYKLIKQ